ncbi:hypothetical protein JCM10213_006428 [Rhodosporidiobolus nylandii]
MVKPARQPQGPTSASAGPGRLSRFSRPPRQAAATDGGEKTETASIGSSATLHEATQAQVAPPRDFGFLPVPSHLQLDPSKPYELTPFTNWLFAAAATITVANLYYCQPILVALSEWYSVPYDTATRVSSLVQAGYLCGLLLLVPLGDLLPRRPLILGCIFLASTLSIGLALGGGGFSGFEAITFLAGALNVVPQILVPLAADLAHPSKRASAVSIVLSGLIAGMVWGRFFAGLLARFTTSPLHVYWLAAGAQYALFAVLWWFLPAFPAKKLGLNYFQILWSMVKLFFTSPTLVQSCLAGFLSCTVMVNWWTSLTFLLSDSPFHYSTFEIGLFGLTGICTVAFAPQAGKITDRILPWLASLFALFGQLATQSIATGAARLNLAPVILGCIGTDLFHQSMTIGNQRRNFSVDPNARSRVNAVYMVFVFCGQATGSSAGPKLFLHYGWRASYGFSVALVAAAIVTLLVRGPHTAVKQWVGWGGRYSLRKEKPLAAKADEEIMEVKEEVEAQRAEGFLQEEDALGTSAEPRAGVEQKQAGLDTS